MAKKNQRRSRLDKLLNRVGAADEIEGQLEELEESLDSEGVEHKSLSLEKVEAWLTKQLFGVQNKRIEENTKAKITADDLVDLVMLAYEQIIEAGSEADPREVAMELVSAAFEGAEEPVEDVDIEIGETERQSDLGETEEEDEEEKAAKLDLIATVSDDMAATLKATIETRNMLAVLKDVPENVATLAEKMAAVEVQLAQRPRASESGETILDIGRVQKIVKAAVKAETADPKLVTVGGINGLLPEEQQE